MKKSDTGLACVGMAAIFIAVLIFLPILNGFVLMKIWNWIMVKMFEQLPVLTLFQSIGISLVIGYITGSGSMAKTEGDKEKAAWNIASIFLLRTGGTLMFGYVISLMI